MRVHAGVHVVQRHERPEHHARAHQEHHGQGHLADDQQAPRTDADCAFVTAALLQPVVEIGAACAERRQEAREDAGEHRRGGDEQRHARVDGDLVSARDLIGEDRGRCAEAEARQQQSRQSAGGREDQRLREQLLEDAPAPGAQRRTDRQFLTAAEATREQQVPDVRACDQQHESDRAEQHQERGPDVADDELLQRQDRRAPARVFLWIVALEPLGDRVHLGLRTLDRHAGLQARDHLHVVVIADRPVFIGERQRYPDVPRDGAPGQY